MLIKSLPLDSRPREKMIKYGSKSLSEAELLAVILGTGNKKEGVLKITNNLVSDFGIEKLSKMNISVLRKRNGLGIAKSCQIKACFELGRRVSLNKSSKSKSIKSSKYVADFFIPEIGNIDREEFFCVYLNSRNKIIRREKLFVGTLDESVIHPRDIFKIALEENAAGIILVHNHPSGNPSPSEFDIESTEQIVSAGEFLGIPVLDHVIIAGKKYFSFKDEKLI